jgi:glycine/D-amino acid oxidase-like deaminating enzyme
MSNTLDTILIGQGLAGSLLAWRLLKQGCRILIIDEAASSSTSRVAAGLINPIIGKRLVLHNEVPAALATAQQTYGQITERLSRQYLYPRRMLRLLNSDEDRQLWQKRLGDPCYADYLSTALLNPRDYGLQGDKAIEQYHCAYLDTGALLDDLQAYFRQQGIYQRQAITSDMIQLHSGGVRVAGHNARRLIFCEGYQASHNPWFAELPWQMSQGEILTLKIDGLQLQHIINGRYWLLPLADGHYRMGASYSHKLDLQRQPQDKTQMLAYLRQLLANEYAVEVLEDQVGIRPNTLDKAPFIGVHPKHSQLWMFNGFGSRGSLLIPYYAQLLLDCLLYGKALPGQADIRRVM